MSEPTTNTAFEPRELRTQITVDRALIRAYAAASGDDNPIHVDDEAARAIGLPGVIAHGMWTFGAALRLLVDHGIDPATVRSASCKFARPVTLPESGEATLDVAGLEAERGHLAISVTQDGERVAKLEVTL